MGNLPGITTSRTRNPSEEGDSAEESPLGIGFHRELPAYLQGFRPVRSKFAENPSNSNNSRISSSKSYVLTSYNANFKKIKYENLFKIKNKPDRPF
jgi:hypothetical protein